MKGQWLTPDAPAEGYICREIQIPNSVAFAAIVDGCLLELTRSWNFEKVGTLTPEQVASLFHTMFDDYVLRSDCMGVPPGMIMYYGGNNNPPGWVVAGGQQLDRTTYAALFAVIGTTFGAGNGTTTFNVPNLRARFVAGAQFGNPGYNLGNTGGQDAVTLTVNQIPAHQHTQPAHSHSEVIASPVLINGGLEAPASSAVPAAGTTGTAAPTTNNTGGGLSHENRPSYIALYPMIKY